MKLTATYAVEKNNTLTFDRCDLTAAGSFQAAAQIIKAAGPRQPDIKWARLAMTSHHPDGIETRKETIYTR